MKNLLMKPATKEDLEKVILINAIGLVEALNKNLITIEEAEKVLFSPYMMEQLEYINVSKPVLEVIHLGTELEDVNSIIPDKLAESLAEIKEKSLNLLEERKAQIIEERVINSETK